MTSHRLDGFQTEMQMMGAAVTQGQRAIQAVGRTPAGAQPLAKVTKPFAAFAGEWRGVDADMGGMLITIQANLPNYEAVAALPSFDCSRGSSLFPARSCSWVAAIGLVGSRLLGLAALGRGRSSGWR